MDLIATRDLARIQTVLYLVKGQSSVLSELTDIQAFRGLEETCPILTWQLHRVLLPGW